MSARRRSSRRRTGRSRGAWPLWVRLLVLAVIVGGVVWVVLWFNALATWAKVLVGLGGVALIALWWGWTRRHEIRAEMARRADEDRRRL